jgi:Lrp/AsnC family transcriptional regulator for asnA, asnC and gidA|tara:strand:- start:68 stop:538 length:471 start_codon:yes stop_codon:yes gene_type:complete
MDYQIDNVDRHILAILIKNSRTPFTEIAQKLLISAGTVHVRYNKMEEAGIIKSSTLVLDYEVMGYTFTGYVGISLTESAKVSSVLEDLRKIPEVTVASFTTGQYGIYCKVRCKDTVHARDIITKIMSNKGVRKTDTMVCLEERINDKNRLIRSVLN